MMRPDLNRFKLIVYVPEMALEQVKKAMFEAGAGKTLDGHYDECCWQVLGQGQFRPLEGANPAIGSTAQLIQLPEWRVEVLVEGADCLRATVKAMKQVHPYEEVAYEVYPLMDIV